VRADAGTGGTVRISIYGRHSTNKDFLVSRNKEDRTVFDPNLFCRAAWNSFLITTDGLSAHTAIVVRHGERPPATARRFDGATENAGFSAKLHRNFRLDFVTKQHISLQKLQQVCSLV